MISSISSSTSLAVRGAIAVAIVSLAACGHGRPRPGPLRGRLAVFPVQNASGGTAPVRPLADALEAALRERGLDVVPRRDLDVALATHRIRYLGGVGKVVAKPLREELGVDAVLVPTLQLHAVDAPPKVSLGLRLVETGERPRVLWADSVARSGDDAPGLLGRGLVARAAELEKDVVARAARAVERRVKGGAAGASCGDAGRFGPHHVYRAPVLDDVGRRSIAVLPFVDGTSRRSAGEVLQGQFVEQLARSGAFEVLDPGIVREELLSHRMVLPGGVSVDAAMALLTLLGADLVLSGSVEVYEAPSGSGVPKIEFTSYVLDRRAGELVWSSRSTGKGDDGVFFFGAGRVHTSSALSCRMVRGVVDRLVGKRGVLARADSIAGAPQSLRARAKGVQARRGGTEK